MKLGEVILGSRNARYQVTSEPTNAGGGTCQWAFCSAGGADLFIKQFLSPKYPLDSSRSSEKVKAARRAECERFEARHRAIGAVIEPKTSGGGNLIATLDFFRHEASFYKVTERVEAVPYSVLPDFGARNVKVLLRTLVRSLRILHDAGIVHSDLKPNNVLVQAGGGADIYTCKLIDYDAAYFVDSVPPSDMIAGFPVYYSPEMLLYVREDPAVGPSDLSTASDIFALSLLIHVLLDGDLPRFDTDRFAYACASVSAGAQVEVRRDDWPETFVSLLNQGLQREPTERPSIDDFVDTFQKFEESEWELLAGETSTMPKAPPATGGPRKLVLPARGGAGGGPGPAPGSGASGSDRRLIGTRPKRSSSTPRKLPAEPTTEEGPRLRSTVRRRDPD